MRNLGTLGLIFLLSVGSSVSAAETWTRHTDPVLGYRIDLPSTSFASAPQDDTEALRLSERDGGGLLEVYGGENAKRLPASVFADRLSAADRIAEVTYRAQGRTWFVLSGYYRRDQYEEGQLIFYAKFMFSPDLGRFSAFEISYPVEEKAQMNAVVKTAREQPYVPGAITRSKSSDSLVAKDKGRDRGLCLACRA